MSTYYPGLELTNAGMPTLVVWCRQPDTPDDEGQRVQQALFFEGYYATMWTHEGLAVVAVHLVNKAGFETENEHQAVRKQLLELVDQAIRGADVTPTSGQLQYGRVVADGFAFPCGCQMQRDGTLRRCSTHQPPGYVGAETIVEAVTALGLLKEPRRIHTCATCGMTGRPDPLIGKGAGWFTSLPSGWENEDWQRIKPSPASGHYEGGRAEFCSRRCRGEWLLNTAGELRKP